MNIVNKFNREFLFYVGYFLLIINDMYVNIPIFNKFHTIIMCVSLLLIILFVVSSFTNNKIDKKKIILMFIISVLLAFFYLFSRDLTIFKIYILSIALIFIDFDSFLEKDLKVRIFALITLFIIASFITIPGNTNRLDGTVRYALGTQHSNILSAHIMIIIFEMYYLYFSKKFNILFFIILITSIFFELIVPNTRTCIFILMLFLVYYVFFNNRAFIFQKLKKLLCYLPVILTIITLILSVMIFEDNEIVYKINNALSERLNIFGDYLDKVHISFFGKDIMDLQEGTALDSTYLYLLLKFGIIQFLVVIYFISKTLKKLIEQKKYNLSVIIVLLELYAFVETTPLVPTINVFILLISINFEDLLSTKKIEIVDNEIANEKVNIKEVQQLQVDMLVKLVKFLDENNINYYLCGGTLLGAIRHKGFIPWDDDIDIFVPRPEYEKLIEIATDKYISENLVIRTIKSRNHDFPFIKLYNVDYKVEEENIQTKEEYLWVDIFPVDGMSENIEENKKLYKKITYYRGLLNIRMYKDDKFRKLFKNKIKKFLRIIQKSILSLLPTKFYSRKINKISQKYSYEKSNYVGGIMWGYGPQERIKKEEFLKIVRVDFEDHKFKTFACWNSYLKNLYGDYMKLPPVSERKIHLTNFVRLNNNEKSNNN